MKKGCLSIITGIVFFVIIIVILFIWSSYKTISDKSNESKEALIQVQNQYKKHDSLALRLINIPLLKGKELNLQKILESEEELIINQERSFERFNNRQKIITQSLNEIRDRTINDTFINKDSSFIKIKEELINSRTRIYQECNNYNSIVKLNNSNIVRVPNSFIAKQFGFHRYYFFICE